MSQSVWSTNTSIVFYLFNVSQGCDFDDCLNSENPSTAAAAAVRRAVVINGYRFLLLVFLIHYRHSHRYRRSPASAPSLASSTNTHSKTVIQYTFHTAVWMLRWTVDRRRRRTGCERNVMDGNMAAAAGAIRHNNRLKWWPVRFLYYILGVLRAALVARRAALAAARPLSAVVSRRISPVNRLACQSINAIIRSDRRWYTRI